MALLLRVFAALALLCWSSGAGAADQPQSTDAGIVVLTPPLLISLKMPRYPTSALDLWEEGWVHFTFTVDAKGAVSNIKAVDGFHLDLFEVTAEKALATALYKPAMENGVPVSWDRAELNVPFTIVSPYALSITQDFANEYKKVNALITAKDYTAARRAVETALQGSSVTTLLQFALMEECLYRIEVGDHRAGAALDAIDHAASAILIKHDGGVSAQAPRILEQKIIYDAAFHRYAEARDSLDELAQMGTFTPDPKIDEIRAQIKAAIDSDKPIEVPALIEDGKWEYTPTWRTLSVAALKGQITDMELSCNRHAATIPFQLNVEWTLPESWGGCRLEFGGAEGTSFTILEYKHPKPSP